MGRFSDVFLGVQEQEEVFAPKPVVESAEVSAPTVQITELTAPESVSEEREIFNPNARDADGDGLVQEGTIHERPVIKKARKRS